MYSMYSKYMYIVHTKNVREWNRWLRKELCLQPIEYLKIHKIASEFLITYISIKIVKLYLFQFTYNNFNKMYLSIR